MSLVHVQRKDASFTVGFNPPDFDRILSFDLAGRLIGVYVRECNTEETNYRRGLDNRVIRLVKDRTLRNRCIAPLGVQERDALFRACFQWIEEAQHSPTLSDADRRLLQTAAGNGPGELAAQADRFRAIYGTVPILPPDQYRSLVLQVTRGCPFNDCTFCSFYRGSAFHVLSPDEFQNHLESVRAFFGESLRLRHSVFLGDANAILLPTSSLLDRMEQARAVFDIAPSGLSAEPQATWRRSHPMGLCGFYGFLDGLSGTRKTIDDYRRLAAAGLKRVYIGAESGCDALLQRLRKPSRRADVVETVQLCKQAGVGIGLILLAGVCLDEPDLAERHRRDTRDLVRDLPLDARDIVYLSPFVPEGAATPTLPREVEKELAWFEQAVERRSDGPRVVCYDIRGFIY